MTSQQQSIAEFDETWRYGTTRGDVDARGSHAWRVAVAERILQLCNDIDDIEQWLWYVQREHEGIPYRQDSRGQGLWRSQNPRG